MTLGYTQSRPVPLPVNQGGTGSTTQNFVDLTNTQTVGGAKTFTSAVQAGDSSHNGSVVIYDQPNAESGTITRGYRTGTGEGAFFMDELQLTGGRFSFDPNGGKAEFDLNSNPTFIVYDVQNGSPYISIDPSHNATFTGVIFPVQAPTASAPSYVKGGMYFDTTLNKLRIGGATAWETVTSV